ncbi:MAG TPA: carbon monoxide dehydrogenase subunit G [Terriglobales bacterium]|nr:carbon monoxide dehydrogenase subunit G [Terriglobales bacterium]
MKIQGTYTVPAPRNEVWNALMDPAILERAIPGCEKLTPLGDNRYTAILKAGVGNIKGTFNSEIALTELRPPASYTLTSKAKAPVGFVEGAGQVSLEEADGGAATTVRFAGDAKMGGMLASVAGRLFEAAAQKNIGDMFKNLAKLVAK